MPLGKGRVSPDDNNAYRQTFYKVTIALTKDQYDNLLEFSENPKEHGFNDKFYNLLTNSCVDFVYASLRTIGYNKTSFDGVLIPTDNIIYVDKLLNMHGAQIIRDNLTLHDDCYKEKEFEGCRWLSPEERVSYPKEGTSLINIDINTSPQPQTSIQGENQAQQDVANGYIVNAATHKVFAFEDLLSNTDFTSSQMASLASGGIRPGEMQLDPIARPNSWLSEFYRPSYESNADFSFNAATLNGLSAMKYLCRSAIAGSER